MFSFIFMLAMFYKLIIKVTDLKGIPKAILLEPLNSLTAKKLPSSRNQSIDLLCKSTGWFLHYTNFSI